VNLLALAERRKSWPDDEVFVCVKIGTLISAAVVVHGRPVHGVDQLAGELGHIGEALASVVNLLNPGVITAWGYLTEAETTLFAGIREGLYQAALPRSSENLRLVRTSLGDLAGVRGAALMVIDEVLEPAAVDRAVAGGSWASAWPLGAAGSTG